MIHILSGGKRKPRLVAPKVGEDRMISVWGRDPGNIKLATLCFVNSIQIILTKVPVLILLSFTSYPGSECDGRVNVPEMR